MIYPPVPYPLVPRCSPQNATGPVEDALVGPSHRDFEVPEPLSSPHLTLSKGMTRYGLVSTQAACTAPLRPPSPPRSPDASDSGAIPTRETSLALDTRAIDLAAPAASVQPPQLQATPQRARPSVARHLSSSSSHSSRLQSSPLTTRVPPRIGQATSTSNDVHAKAALATEILRLEHRVALLRKARRIQLANDRAERESTAKLERRAEKWREASALAAELLVDRFGVVVSAAASTFSSSPLAGRPSTTLFGSSTLDDNDHSASDYLLNPSNPLPLFSSASSRGPSHADRLADFRRSLTAAAHARGISEQEVLRQLEEEEGLDPLQSPEVEFDRLLPSTTAGRKRKRWEEVRDFTRGEEEDEVDNPEFGSLSSSASSAARNLPGWKPPRADRGDTTAAAFSQSRMTTKKEQQLSSPRLPPLRDDDDDDDELLRALDTVMAEGSSRRRFCPPPAGYLPSSQLASDHPHEAQHFDQEKELAGRRDPGGDSLTSLISPGVGQGLKAEKSKRKP